MNVGGLRVGTIVIGYLVAQAVLTVAWWLLLRASTGARSSFELSPQSAVLDAFLVADLAVFVAGSLASALAIHRRWISRTAIVWFTAGGIVSATTFLVALVLAAGSAATGIAPMVAASVATVAVAAVAAPPERTPAVAR